MTIKEYKRLQDFLRDHQNHVETWHGCFKLHESYAEKNGVYYFQHMSILSATKSEVLKYPAKHIQSVDLYVKNYGKDTKYF